MGIVLRTSVSWERIPINLDGELWSTRIQIATSGRYGTKINGFAITGKNLEGINNALKSLGFKFSKNGNLSYSTKGKPTWEQEFEGIFNQKTGSSTEKVGWTSVPNWVGVGTIIGKPDLVMEKSNNNFTHSAYSLTRVASIVPPCIASTTLISPYVRPFDNKLLKLW